MPKSPGIRLKRWPMMMHSSALLAYDAMRVLIMMMASATETRTQRKARSSILRDNSSVSEFS